MPKLSSQRGISNVRVSYYGNCGSSAIIPHFVKLSRKERKGVNEQQEIYLARIYAMGMHNSWNYTQVHYVEMKRLSVRWSFSGYSTPNIHSSLYRLPSPFVLFGNQQYIKHHDWDLKLRLSKCIMHRLLCCHGSLNLNQPIGHFLTLQAPPWAWFTTDMLVSLIKCFF